MRDVTAGRSLGLAVTALLVMLTCLALAPAASTADVGSRAVVASVIVRMGPVVPRAAKRPVVNRVCPAAGPRGGGTAVTITGRNFRCAGKSIVRQVRFGGRAATGVRVRSARKLTVKVPAGAGAVDVRVVTNAGTSARVAAARYTYRAVGTKYLVTASNYKLTAGSSVTISAQIAGANGSRVARAGVKVTWTKVGTGGALSSATSVTDAKGIATVMLTTDASVAATYTVRATDAASRTGVSPEIATTAYGALVTGVSPSGGPTIGGQKVTITGSGLARATGVSFGSSAVPSFAIVSDSRITAVTPGHAAGAADVSVVTPGGTSMLAGAFTYTLYAIEGVVQGATSRGAITNLSGASVIVRIDAMDPCYDAANAANNVVGTATTDASGDYAISTASFRGAPLPAGTVHTDGTVGTVVDVTATRSGYLSVTQYGAYDRATVVCSFKDYTSQGGGERWLPYDSGTVPPLPFEHLLPNYQTAP